MAEPRRRQYPVEHNLLLTATLCLLAFGAVMVFSATSAPNVLQGGDGTGYLVKYLTYGAVGLLVMHIMSRGGLEIARRFTPVIYHLKEWVEGNRTVQREVTDDKGGTMRLGAYDAVLTEGSRVEEIYGTTTISERHRHRYEVDIKYRDRFEAAGVVFSGVSPDGRLPEIVELPEHPWFIGVQFHPELKSKPFAPHPLFADFVRAALAQSRLV